MKYPVDQQIFYYGLAPPSHCQCYNALDSRQCRPAARGSDSPPRLHSAKENLSANMPEKLQETHQILLQFYLLSRFSNATDIPHFCLFKWKLGHRRNFFGRIKSSNWHSDGLQWGHSANFWLKTINFCFGFQSIL